MSGEKGVNIQFFPSSSIHAYKTRVNLKKRSKFESISTRGSVKCLKLHSLTSKLFIYSGF